MKLPSLDSQRALCPTTQPQHTQGRTSQFEKVYINYGIRTAFLLAMLMKQVPKSKAMAICQVSLQQQVGRHSWIQFPNLFIQFRSANDFSMISNAEQL